MKKRIEWVDIAKYICIMFVMISHLESNTSNFQRFYEPFFLTTFFFLSGYCYYPVEKFHSFIIKKIRQLLIPWFVFSNLIILSAGIITFNKHNSVIEELIWNILQIRKKGDQLWFIFALFIAFIPFYYVVKYNKKRIENKIIICAVFACFSGFYCKYFPQDIYPWNSNALPWHLEYIFQAVFFMVLGYYFKVKYESIMEHLNTKKNIIILLIIYLFNIFILDKIIDIVFIDMISSIIGVILVIWICKHVKSNKYIKYVGGNTLIYFALHGKLLSVIQKILHTFSFGYYEILIANEATSILLACFIAFIMSILLIIPTYIINRWFPGLVGRNKRRLS